MPSPRAFFMRGSSLDADEPRLDDLYREVVLDHYRSPRGRDPVAHPDVVNIGLNPLCGDEVTVSLKFEGGRVSGVQAASLGCSISVASGSMMAELLKGKTREEVMRLLETFRSMMHGDAAPVGAELGDLEALQGVRKYPVRIKCALLPWMTLKDALEGGAGKPTTTDGDDSPGRLE